MLPWLMGFLGFGLYLLYDIDSFTGLWKPLRLGFAAGTALIGTSTLLQMVSAWRQNAFSGAGDFVLLALGLLSFAALCLHCFNPLVLLWARTLVLQSPLGLPHFRVLTRRVRR